MIYFRDIEQLLVDNGFDNKDFVLFQGKILFESESLCKKVSEFLEQHGYQTVVGDQINHAHWRKKYSKYLHFENLS